MNRTANLHQVLLQSMSNIASDEHDGPCKLQEAAQLAGELYASELRMGQIQLDINIEPHITLDIPNNVAILVLCNLVSNAKDAIGRDGTIYIEASDDEDAIRCCVTDDGAGIEPDAIEHIFDLGFTTKGARRGRGLTLSGRVLERSGAQLELTNSGPGGTTFTIHLPKQK
jgi:two-component system sensor histidine kinase DcuS